jgi:hypothetical protein
LTPTVNPLMKILNKEIGIVLCDAVQWAGQTYLKVAAELNCKRLDQTLNTPNIFADVVRRFPAIAL